MNSKCSLQQKSIKNQKLNHKQRKAHIKFLASSHTVLHLLPIHMLSFTTMHRAMSSSSLFTTCFKMAVSILFRRRGECETHMVLIIRETLLKTVAASWFAPSQKQLTVGMKGSTKHHGLGSSLRLSHELTRGRFFDSDISNFVNLLFSTELLLRLTSSC